MGHTWVIYGYDKGYDPDRRFKMNMGWSGSDDGWYSCDSVDYTIDQHQVTEIAPESIVKFVGASDGGDGTPNDPYQSIEEALAEAPGGATLIFKAGSDNTFSVDTLTIGRPLTFKGKNATIREE